MDAKLLASVVREHDSDLSPYFRGVYTPATLDTGVIDDNTVNFLYTLTDSHFVLFLCAPYANVFLFFDALAKPLDRHAPLLHSFVSHIAGDGCLQMRYAVQDSKSSSCAAFCLYVTACALRHLSPPSSPAQLTSLSKTLLSQCTAAFSASSPVANERRVKRWFCARYRTVPSSVFSSAVQCFKKRA